MEDNHYFGEDSEIANDATEKMITGLGILIGFSWEQSFDTAVDVVAEGCPGTILHPLGPRFRAVLLLRSVDRDDVRFMFTLISPYVRY